MQQQARSEKPSPDALVQEALEHYVKWKRHRDLQDFAQAQARKLSIEPRDIGRLITDSR